MLAGMPAGDDQDELIRGPRPPRAPAGARPGSTALPASEPEARSLADERDGLARSIAELEGALRYMGTSHPGRRASETRLGELRQMLARLTRELGGG